MTKVETHFASPRSPYGQIALQAGLILLLVAWIYAPALHGGWLWDDNSEITTNLDLRGPWWRIWVHPAGPDYFPLKTTVQWLQWRGWRADSTTGYHACSVGLHALSALLVWRLASRLGLRCGWLAGLLFAIHPLAVESVAWIAELKNTLSLPPLLLAMLAWIDFQERGGKVNYVRALAWFLAAVLCKSSVVTLPVVLAMYQVWRGRGSRRELKPLVPFFAVALISGLTTIWFQTQRTGYEITLGGPVWRVALAGTTSGFYAAKILWPASLMPIYPAWSMSAAWGWGVAGWLGWIGLGVAAWRSRKGWGRHALFATGCFLAVLAPVLGFVPMAFFYFSWVSDHLAYLALVPAALLLAGVSGVLWARASHRVRIVLVAIAMMGVGTSAIRARAYAMTFRDADTFWTHALAQNPESWLAANNLGVVRLEARRWNEAADLFATAARLKPDYPVAQSNWGDALLQLQRVPEAIAHFETALQLDPNAVEAHFNLANALVSQGKLDAAVGHYEAAVRLAPASVDAGYNLANTLLRLGRLSEAAVRFRSVLALRPDLTAAHLGLGNALAAGGDLVAARTEFEIAVEQSPDSVEARYCLADALVELREAQAALPHYRRAVELAPERAEIHLSYGAALLATGNRPAAIDQFEITLRLQPGNPEARAGLQQAQRR
jgi:tetratricopeptide (TPR) repeat protein